MRNLTTLLFALCAIGLFGCNAITDFSDIEGGYSIKDQLVTPIVVELSGDTGTIALSFDKVLPQADDEQLLSLLSDQVVTVSVRRVETGTTYSLTQGLLVSGTPSSSGQYSLSLSEDRKTIAVSFFNAFNGAAVQAGESYTALIEVETNEFFKVDAVNVNEVEVVAQ
ncbi:MAG: hypothetical protein MUC50_00540 [Myxococcota bacterium]|jgi:hypothetical protein|nr:hypothetical protein [Myxococcota bacterium]